MKSLVIGISGATCTGKTTLALNLKKKFPKSKVVHQDNYYFDNDDPRHVWCKDQNHINYDILTSLDMEKMVSDVQSIVHGRKLCKKTNNQDRSLSNGDISHNELCSRINELIKEKNIELVFLDGFRIYNYKPLLPIITLKYFLLLNKEKCVTRRKERIYDPPEFPGYLEDYVWPEYVKHLEEIRSSDEDITYFSNESEDVLDVILKDIYYCLQVE